MTSKDYDRHNVNNEEETLKIKLFKIHSENSGYELGIYMSAVLLYCEILDRR